MRSERSSSNSPKTHQWLSVQQVAEHLQVSRVTVWRWLRAGRLSGIRIGRIRRIALHSVQQFTRQERGKSPAVAAEGRGLGTIFTLTHPLWELVGKGRGGGANVSGNKYKFLANAYRRR